MPSIDHFIPRRLVVNGLAIFGGEAATRLTTLAMALIVARRFGADALGQYGYAVALTSILLLVPDFGLHLQAVRELAKNPSRLGRVLGMMCALKSSLAIAVIVFVVAVGFLGGNDRARRDLLFILLLRLLFQTFSQGFMSIFKAHEQMHYITVQQSTNAIFAFAWAGIALLTQANLETMVLGLIVGQVAETWMGWRILRSNFIKSMPLEIRWLDLKPMVLAAAPIGATAVLQALHLRLDVLILSRYVSNRELGNFQAAASFLVVTYLGASLGMTVLFPRFSRELQDASEGAVRSVEGILKYAILVATCGASLIWLSAPQLLRLTYGSDLGGAAGALRIVAGALPLVLLNSILFYVFVALDRPGVYFSALVVGILGGGLAGIVLSARFGATGAA
ncbi:MAG: oligosaccharide flippase family protein, partial [Acidobacteria bacterium]|nr:oligosaccharide flippase family protein [Acidobacteriota bacterium]